MIGFLATGGPHDAVREASVGPSTVLRVDSRSRFPVTRRRPGFPRARLRWRVPASLCFLRKYLAKRTRLHFQRAFGLIAANVVRRVVAVRSQRRWRTGTLQRETNSLVLRQAGARSEGCVVRTGVLGAAHLKVSSSVYTLVCKFAVKAPDGAHVLRTQIIQVRVSEGRSGSCRDAVWVVFVGDAAPERGRERVSGALAFASQELLPSAGGDAVHVAAAVFGVWESTLRPALKWAAGGTRRASRWD